MFSRLRSRITDNIDLVAMLHQCLPSLARRGRGWSRKSRCIRKNTLTLKRSPYGLPWQGGGRLLHSRAKINNSGFTLVEILVATAMLVIIIGAIYGVFRAASQSSIMVEENADVYQTARVLLGRITGELSSLHKIAGSQGSCLQGQNASEDGNPPGFDTLTFTTVSHQPVSEVTQSGDVCTISYSARCSQDGKPLGLFVTEDYTLGLRLNQTDEDSLPSTQLSDMVVGMNCTYLDPDSSEWVDDWMNRTALPSAVRIELIIQPKRKSAQPVSLVSTVSLPTWANGVNTSDTNQTPSGGDDARQ